MEGAGSTTVTVMLFNTVIPLSNLGIKALSSQSVVFRWERRERRARRRANNEGPRGKFQAFDSARCCVGPFLCLTNNRLETGKSSEVKSSAFGCEVSAAADSGGNVTE